MPRLPKIERKPAPALIYILFVLFFLTAREVRRFAPQTPLESLVNAVEMAEAVALGRLTRGTRARALALLSASDPAQPLVPMLRQAFEQAPLREQTSRLDALMLRLRAAYGRLSDHRWFRRLVGFAFVLQVGAMLLAVVYSLRLAAASEGLVVWVILAAAAGAVLLTTFGVVQLWRSRARAYRAFELAVLLDLLLVQPFTLLYSGFAGLTHVLTDLVLLASVWYAGHQERNIQLSG